MIRILRAQNNETPSLDACRHAVNAFMENDALRISVIKDINKHHFQPRYWVEDYRSPSYLKDTVSNLIDVYGDKLLVHCFNEWKKEEKK